jgi:hypothetical protein
MPQSLQCGQLAAMSNRDGSARKGALLDCLRKNLERSSEDAILIVLSRERNSERW